MKKLYFIISFIFVSQFLTAQVETQPENKNQENIEALRVAFITKELELTPDEAQKFWPVYNQYARQMHTIVKEDQDIIDRDEKVLNLRKQYKDEFIKIIGQPRMNRMFGAEGRFRKLLIKRMYKQRNAQPNRPMMKRN